MPVTSTCSVTYWRLESTTVMVMEPLTVGSMEYWRVPVSYTGTLRPSMVAVTRLTGGNTLLTFNSYMGSVEVPVDVS